MSAYVDYTYYTGTFLGSAIASADFPHLALLASNLIDEMTFQRTLPVITDGTDTATIDRIKMACCAVAEEVQKINQDGGESGFTGEGVGGNSISYNQNASKFLTAKSRYSKVAKTYLGSTGLMYPGFNQGEYGAQIPFDTPGDL